MVAKFQWRAVALVRKATSRQRTSIAIGGWNSIVEIGVVKQIGLSKASARPGIKGIRIEEVGIGITGVIVSIGLCAKAESE